MKPFVLIDFEKTNRYGHKVDKASFDMAAFEKNPVMLYMHQRGEVLGRWEDIKMSGSTITAMPVFDEQDEKAFELKGKVERGFIKAASLAFGGECYMKDGVLYSAEVLETSLVDVPAYRESLIKNVSNTNVIFYTNLNGIEMSEIKETNDQSKSEVHKLSALEKENSEMKTTLVLRVLGEGDEGDELKRKAYASLSVKELISLSEKKQSNDTVQKELDAKVLKGIDRLTVALGGKLEGDEKEYHDYSLEELAFLEQNNPEKFNKLINNYNAR